MDDFIPRDNPRYAANLAKFLEGNHPNVPTEVFHASKTDVQKFDPKKRGKLSPFGYHFGTADQANFRTGQYDFESPMPNIGKYHLSMKNPLEVSHMASFAPDHLADHMMDLDILDPDDYDRLNEKHDYEPIPVGGELVKILKKNGYDGLMYQNEREGKGYSFVPFDANQIKSATGNAGGFNREEENINKAYGGALGDEDEGITAYHGSPHDFPTFDMSKIGTGEGAQSYGHGLYFAEAEPVAHTYRGDPEERYRRFSGHMDPKEEYAFDLASHAGEKTDWDIMKGLAAKYGEGISYEDAEKLAKNAISKRGHMYEVRIKAKPEHMLDWDTPLESQPLNIRDAIDEALLHAENKAGNRKFMVGTFNGALFPEKNTVHRNFERLTGGAIHDMLSKVFSPEELSQRLSESGIKGIRYLDQNSRQNREGTRNYVIFDDKLVDVKRKYEQGGRAKYANKGRVIPDMENPSEALEMGGMRPISPSLGESYDIPSVDREIQRPMVGAGSKETKLYNEILRSHGKDFARRVQRAADEVPNLSKLYTENALKNALTENDRLLMAMKPSDFLKAATPFETKPKAGYIGQLMDVLKETGFRDVPWLQVRNLAGYPMISGHEGRHRSLALDFQGQPKSLVQLAPYHDMKSAIKDLIEERHGYVNPYDQMRFMKGMREQLPQDMRIIPQTRTLEERQKMQFPEPFKKGGSVTNQAFGENTLMPKKSGRIKRNTGGRIPEMDKLFKRAKKYVDEQTKPMLNLHDDVIVKALNLAKKKV